MSLPKREELRDSPRQGEGLGQVSWALKKDPTTLLSCPGAARPSPTSSVVKGSVALKIHLTGALGGGGLNK